MGILKEIRQLVDEQKKANELTHTVIAWLGTLNDPAKNIASATAEIRDLLELMSPRPRHALQMGEIESDRVAPGKFGSANLGGSVMTMASCTTQEQATSRADAMLQQDIIAVSTLSGPKTISVKDSDLMRILRDRERTIAMLEDRTCEIVGERDELLQLVERQQKTIADIQDNLSFACAWIRDNASAAFYVRFTHVLAEQSKK